MVVYIITNKINGKCYIGKTVKPLQFRWSCHKSLARSGNNTYLHKAMRKHGIDNFEIEPLIELTQDEELLDWEVELIGIFKSNNSSNGYNLTIGGDGITGHKHSDESKQKMTKSNLGRVPWNKGKIGIFSEEALANNRAAHLGKPSGMRGMHHSNESKLKIKNSHLGKKQTKEHIAKRVEAMLNNDIYKQISSKLKGRIPWNKGVRCSEKIRKSIKDGHKRRSIILEAKHD